MTLLIPFLTVITTLQQEHLPKDRKATPQQEYGFSFEDFLQDQWPYLLGIVLVLAIFLYARYNWRKKHKK